MSAPAQRILVPTDFSETAARALDLALDLARRFAAEIHLLHVRVLLEDPHHEEEYHRELERLMTREDQRTREVLGNARDATRQVVVHPHLVRGLSEAETICETVSDLGCDLVVMGTHGRRGLKHFLLGSVAERVVRSCPIPVLTVRPSASARSLEGGRFLVPTDFSEAATTAVSTAAAWASTLGASVTLIHVIEPVIYPEFYAVDIFPDDMMDRIEERSREALDKLAREQLEELPWKVEVTVGRATEAILEAANPAQHDLVVIASRGLSPIEQMLLGSVAEAVVRRSELPVLTVRGDS